jgi:nucleoside phosphorylase
LLDCVFHHVVSQSNDGKLSAGNLLVVRQQIINVLSALSEKAGRPTQSIEDLKEFYSQAADRLRNMGRIGCASGNTFAKKWAENLGPMERGRKLLILTATDVEDKMLLPELGSSGFISIEPRKVGNTIARVFAPQGSIQIFHVRSNSGSSGSAGSALTAKDAVDGLEPEFVMSVGIAFGIDENEQMTHDLLISTRIWNYEPGRLTNDQFNTRGEDLPASSLLLDACRHVREDSDGINFGIIASGEKLVDSAGFVKNIKTQKSQLVGGDMEGSGISAVCQREKTNWIMIKAICDWGNNKSKGFQAESAKLAASYCIRVIKYLATVRN